MASPPTFTAQFAAILLLALNLGGARGRLEAETGTVVKVEEHLVTLLPGSSPDVDQYNSLRLALEAHAGDGPRVVAVTSPAVGDGKTTTALNLAGALAHRRDARVVLVDADLRRPSVGAFLGLANDGGPPGLVDAILEPDLPLERVVTHLAGRNLGIVFAGRSSDEPFELLCRSRTKELLQEARQQYEFVVLDTPPLLLVPDSRLLEDWIDAFLLVVAAHRTPRKLIAEAVHLLNPSKLIGLVFNGADRMVSRYYGDYDGYGYRSSPGGASRRSRAMGLMRTRVDPAPRW